MLDRTAMQTTKQAQQHPQRISLLWWVRFAGLFLKHGGSVIS